MYLMAKIVLRFLKANLSLFCHEIQFQKVYEIDTWR
jgi:hypothetical protein